MADLMITVAKELRRMDEEDEEEEKKSKVDSPIRRIERIIRENPPNFFSDVKRTLIFDVEVSAVIYEHCGKSGMDEKAMVRKAVMEYLERNGCL